MRNVIGRLAWAMLVVCLVLVGIAPAAGAEDPAVRRGSRAGDVLFTVPSGWQRKDLEDGTVSLSPPPHPEGLIYSIQILPPRALKGTLRDQLRSELAALDKDFKDFQQTPVVAQRHTNGYDYASTAFSMESRGQAGDFRYCMLYLAKVGDKAQSVLIASNSSALSNQNRQLSGDFLNTLRFSSLTILSKGPPPLTQGAVDQVNDFLEWLLEVPFTDAQRQAVQDELVDSWKERKQEEMNALGEILKLRAELAALSREQREVARQAMQPEVMKQWRKEDDAMSKMMLEIYDGAHKPLSAGEPPLTRQASDAMIELFYFMACQVHGGAEIQPAPAVKDEWAKKMSAEYPSLPKASREHIAQLPLTWASVRLAWPDASDEERSKLKRQWGQLPQVKELADSLAKIRTEAAASRNESFADVQRRMQQSHQNFTAVSNMGMMMYRSNFNVISNLSGGSYRYRYP